MCAKSSQALSSLMVCSPINDDQSINWGNHRVQVFELNGKFVGKFGTKGSNLGEFSNPVSVANLSNGKIVVSDKENNRIQIFDYIT